MPLRVQIVTAEREVFTEDAVDMVVAPGAEGVVGILPRHAPLLTTLVPGVVRIKKAGSEEAMSVGGDPADWFLRLDPAGVLHHAQNFRAQRLGRRLPADF